MEKIMMMGVEIGFNDLTEETQRKLYLQNNEIYRMNVVQSVYPNIRKLIAKNKKSSSSILDKLFEIETKVYNFTCINNIKLLWKHPNFVKSDEKCNILANSDKEELMLVVIVDKETSSACLNKMLQNELKEKRDRFIKIVLKKRLSKKMENKTIEMLALSKSVEDRIVAAREELNLINLNQMLRNELQGDNNGNVKAAIKKNSKFKMDLENRKELFKSGYWCNREWAVIEETDSSQLNKILRQEIKKYDHYNVKKAIRENPNFRIEDETIKVLFESKNCYNREWAVIEETDSKKLNEMLREEVQGCNERDVVNAILKNNNLKIEEETIKVLFKSRIWLDRRLAVTEETDSKKLNEMFREEVHNIVFNRLYGNPFFKEYDNSEVKKAIRENPNFRMEEETIKVLFESNDRWNRVIAAEEEKNPSKLNEMLGEELRKYNNGDVIYAIMSNINFKTDV